MFFHLNISSKKQYGFELLSRINLREQIAKLYNKKINCIVMGLVIYIKKTLFEKNI